MHNYKISTISKRTALSVAIASLFSAQAMAQQAQQPAAEQEQIEVIAVSGIRSILKSSMEDKKPSSVVSDAI